MESSGWQLGSFLSSNFCEQSVTLINRMSIFCSIVTRESKEPDVKKTKMSGFLKYNLKKISHILCGREEKNFDI